MIIHPSALVQIGNEIQVSAQIELSSKRRGIPSELWFRFPEHFKSQISPHADPFAVALLLLAMKNGEPLQVQGSLSRKLFHGLNEYQQIYHSWFPERFQVIEIQPTQLRDDLQDKPRGQGCAFSGGVDSFYTLLNLLGRSNDDTAAPLTHAVFMAGFDMPLHLDQSIGELTHSFAGMMKELGIHFITGSTNVRKFVNTVDWTNAHGQALGATALFFTDLWDRFYIPSSYTLNAYPKWGSHPALDPLLSTESLEVIHHGAHANRVKKLETVSLAPETYDRLRVCWIQDLGLKNCGQCEKCIRTMVALDILGKLPHYTTFGHQKLNRNKLRKLNMRTYQARLFARELMKEAIRRHKYSTFIDMGYSLLRREIFYRSKCR